MFRHLSYHVTSVACLLEDSLPFVCLSLRCRERHVSVLRDDCLDIKGRRRNTESLERRIMRCYLSAPFVRFGEIELAPRNRNAIQVGLRPRQIRHPPTKLESACQLIVVFFPAPAQRTVSYVRQHFPCFPPPTDEARRRSNGKCSSISYLLSRLALT